MAPPGKHPFAWTKARAEAAALLADDALTDEQIAQRVGITRMGLTKWKRVPAFTERIAELSAEVERRVLNRGIARRVNRIAALNDRRERMDALMAARAGDMANVPGGGTGLLVRQLKMIGSGENARVVEEYPADTALLREMREHEKQAAQELGQWVDRQDVRLLDEDAIRRRASEAGVDPEPVIERLKLRAPRKP